MDALTPLVASDILKSTEMEVQAVRDGRVPEQSDIAKAFATIQQAVQNDPELAWSWQCNIAMPIHDAGIGHKLANVAAARVLRALFDVDMTKHEHYFTNQPNQGEPA